MCKTRFGSQGVIKNRHFLDDFPLLVLFRLEDVAVYEAGLLACNLMRDMLETALQICSACSRATALRGLFHNSLFKVSAVINKVLSIKSDKI